MSRKITKLKKLMFFKNISGVKLAEEVGMPRQLLNYIINKRALPLNSDVPKIARALGVKPNRIWSKQDYFVQALESDFKPKTRNVDKNIKQVSFRAAADCCNALMTKENLNLLGYKSIQDWGTQKLQELENELEELKNDKSN